MNPKITALHHKVLILPDQVEEKTEGGIIFTGNTVERDRLRQTEGVIVNFGENAFEKWVGRTPQVGDRIIYNIYEGQLLKGDDDLEYRLINDRDILAVRS